MNKKELVEVLELTKYFNTDIEGLIKISQDRFKYEKIHLDWLKNTRSNSTIEFHMKFGRYVSKVALKKKLHEIDHKTVLYWNIQVLPVQDAEICRALMGVENEKTFILSMNAPRLEGNKVHIPKLGLLTLGGEVEYPELVNAVQIIRRGSGYVAVLRTKHNYFNLTKNK